MKLIMENWRKHLQEEYSKDDVRAILRGEEPTPSATEPCEPANNVESLSSQLAQMVADSELGNEELGALMDLVYDKIAQLKGLGVEDEEEPSDYKRTSMGFMDESKDERISRKIAYLMDKEGKPRDQAVAIAHSMEERGELE